MQLKDILDICRANEVEHFEYTVVNGDINTTVTGIASDSRKVTGGGIFVCIVGSVSDGHKYIEQVKDKAAVIVVQKGSQYNTEKIPAAVIECDNTRLALALMSAAFYGNPDKKLFTIGITGTKGKTTTTYMIREMLMSAGHKTGLIGTIEIMDGKEVIPANNTTPESMIVHKKLKDMLDNGLDSVVMEVSSQGLMLDRVAGVDFDYGIFSNLSRDHIGPNEHKTFEEYAMWKSKLFTMCKTGIFNADDAHVDMMTEHAACKIVTYGIHGDYDYKANDHNLYNKDGHLGIGYHLSGKLNGDVLVNLPGNFSIYNSLTAIAICRHFNVSQENIIKALKVARVKGRIEVIKVSDEFTLMIDYAHNAMALESLLTTLREYHPHRLVCLFGCGGNRAKSRRYEMGEVSGRLADLTIITSDNPRFEEPQDIIDDIKIGISKTDGKYVEICDRKEAIAYAIHHGEPGDIIVLAGKGHEDYQEIKGKKYPMDERVLIAEILQEDKERADK